MRGVNLNVFTFDYDLTWAGFFMNADQHVYGRLGGRSAASPDEFLTLKGLKYAMREALEAHGAHKGEPRVVPVRTVEQYPAAKRLKPNACIHCHQVWDFRREEMQVKGTWKREHIWVYPLPENIGLKVDREQGNRVRSIVPEAFADRAGVRVGDVLTQVNGQRVASFADIQHALHEAPLQGKITVTWTRDGQGKKAELDLPPGWRETDISWRESMWGLQPSASVYGKDLTAKEKKALGLPETALAFRQGDFVPPPAQKAGIRARDIILGIDNKTFDGMNMLQFNAWVRLNKQVGDRITFQVVRNGKRMDIPMTLARKDF
jgi:serine protease Do